MAIGGLTSALPLVCVFALVLVTANENVNSTKSPADLAALKNAESLENLKKFWIRIYSDIKNTLGEVMKQILPTFLKINAEIELSPSCSADLASLVFGIKNMKLWAFTMLDAFGRPSPGIMEGTTAYPGNYDQCLKIKKRNSYDGHVELTGQYCSIVFRLPLPDISYKHLSPFDKIMNFSFLAEPDTIISFLEERYIITKRVPFRLGVCIPSTCAPQDLQIIFDYLVKDYGVQGQVMQCHVEENAFASVNSEQICVIVIFGVLLLTTVIATSFEVVYLQQEKHQGKPLAKILKCFSARKNVTEMIEVEDKARLKSLDGIRVGAMLCIIVGHIYGLIPIELSSSILNANAWFQNVSFMVIENSLPFVEIFVVATGTIVSYSMLKRLDRGFPFEFFKPTLKRLCRLAPALWAVIGLLFLMSFMGSGPFWDQTYGNELRKCRTNWWGTVFFLNSWFHYDFMCLVPTWYVSADIQLYVVGLLLIYCLHKNFRLGMLLTATFMISSALVVGLDTYLSDLPPAIRLHFVDLAFEKSSMSQTYFRFYAHSGSFCLGILLGYLFHKKPNIALSKVHSIIGWCAATLTVGLIIYGPYNWFQGRPVERWAGALYQSTHRTVFALSVSWIIFYSVYQEGFLQSFTSWKVFLPISKLMYLVYLTQYIVIKHRNAMRRTLLYISHYNQIYELAGLAAISFAISFALYVIVEAPFAALTSLAFPKPIPLSQKMLAKTRSGPQSTVQTELKTTLASRFKLPSWFSQRTPSLSPSGGRDDNKL